MQLLNQEFNRFMRNKDLIPQNKLDEVCVIGLGGIGSSVVSLLAIMGFDSIIGYDDDTLEEHNLSTCIYPHKYVGKSKAFAAQALIHEYASLSVGVCESLRWTYNLDVYKNMIICPDNMEVRRDVYDKWVKQKDRGFLIDLRMDALAMEIITVTKDHDDFDSSWVPSAAIEDAPCTMKHTIFTSSIVAGLGVNQVFNVLAHKPWYSYIWVGLMPLNIQRENLIKP